MTTNIEYQGRRQHVELALARFPELTAEQRRFLSVILHRRGWHLLLHKRMPSPPRGRVAGFLVNTRGIFAMVFTGTPLVDAELNWLRDRTEELVAGLEFGRRKLVPHQGHILLLMSDAGAVRGDGRFLCAEPGNLRKTLSALPIQFSAAYARAVVAEIAGLAAEYTVASFADEEPTPTDGPGSALFDADDARRQQRETAAAGSLAEWMVFLDPEQVSVVARDYNGPARICGPAGTGKSVVALHRMARQAKRSTGPLLFTTFARNLPACRRTQFAKLAPGAQDRATFVDLHRWAMDLLNQRKVPFRLSASDADGAFKRVWRHSRAVFDVIEPDQSYWRDELDRVIKGRGITRFDQYAEIRRTGRDARLPTPLRQRVWEQLFEPYEQIRAERGFFDFNDVIVAALNALRAQPLSQPYDLVVVDEVQDLTLVELQLAHAIAGGGDDAQLLLAGDGQQQVYAGGWRLRDAGIDIRGRGDVLRVNYRNRAKISAYAAAIEAPNSVDDLDDHPVVTLRDAVVVLDGGKVDCWCGPRQSLPAALVHALGDCGAPQAECVVITATNRQSERLITMLRAAGIRAMRLESYDCRRHNAVKVGTVHGAKGLEFTAVFHIVESPTPWVCDRTDNGRHRAAAVGRQHLVAASRARDYLWKAVIDAG